MLRAPALVALLGCLGLLAAGCGGGSQRTAAAQPPTAVTTVTAGRAPTVAVPRRAALSCMEGSCYSPQQLAVAYGIQPLLDRGIDGRGETVTVVSPVPTPADAPTDVRTDMASFDRTFRLPPVRIEVVTALGGGASPWQAAGEEVGDFEHLHAVAPDATLRVVLIPSSWIDRPANATADMLAVLRLALEHTDVASISWSLGEHYFTRAQAAEMHALLVGAAARHVTVVASSGDNGFDSDPWFGSKLFREVSLPASDPLVLSVGGTWLTVNPKTGAYAGETAFPNAGGGFSHLHPRPSYQNGVSGISTHRGVPDVSADAYAIGGMALVFTTSGGPYLDSPSGTSGSTPLWAGLVALADQYAHHDLGFINPVIYRIARSSSYHKAFHDVRTGSNGYPAAPGWDPVTGWGSPNAQVLIPLLVRLSDRSTT
jgi:subtilase family serine protease